MTVYFTICNIEFSASGMKHVCQGKPGFIVQHIYLHGSAVDLKPILNADFVERVQEAAAEAAEDEIPFGEPQPLSRLPIELGDDEVEALR